MRQSQQNKRTRGRGRKSSNPTNRVHESNGPDVKVRGSAAHIAEKYVTLARDAQVAGDRIVAENYLQHAEHYFRIVAASQSQQNQQAQNGQQRGGQQDSGQPNTADQQGKPEQGQGGKAAAEEISEKKQPRGRRRRKNEATGDIDGVGGEQPSPATTARRKKNASETASEADNVSQSDNVSQPDNASDDAAAKIVAEVSTQDTAQSDSSEETSKDETPKKNSGSNEPVEMA